MAPDAVLDPETISSSSDEELLTRMRDIITVINSAFFVMVECIREAEQRRWARKRGDRLTTVLTNLGMAPAVAAHVVQLASRWTLLSKSVNHFREGWLSLEHVSAIRDTALSISNERDSAGPHGGIPVNEDSSLNCLRVNNSSEHGRVLIRADLDVVTGARVATAIDALVTPRADEPRSAAQMRADALGLLVDRAAQSDSGLSGRAQILVTVPADNPDLSSLNWMGPIAARVAERLACDAVIQLAGLDGSGVPLALGRRRRLFSEHQRKALLLRDKGCIKCGDQRPWVHAHHVRHWSQGGNTDMNSAVPLCQPCHVDVHDNGWEITFGLDGYPRLRAPATVDPSRTLIRSYYRRTMTLDNAA